MRIKITVTIFAFLLIIIRLIWPSIKFDAISVSLLVIAVLPWLDGLLKSAKFPGGWEITFRDIEEAAAPIISNGHLDADEATAPTLIEIADFDPNLSLVYMRIEIEKRVRALAKIVGLREDHSLISLINDLRDRKVIDRGYEMGLKKIIGMGNRAAHGAQVDTKYRDSLVEIAPKALASLDRLLEERGAQAKDSSTI